MNGKSPNKVLATRWRNFAALTGWFCATVFMAAPGAAAESKLRDDVTAMVMVMDGPRDKNCAERKISDNQVLEVRPDGTAVIERWTLNRCGKSINYLVRFTRNAKGGTDFDVQLEK